MTDFQVETQIELLSEQDLTDIAQQASTTDAQKQLRASEAKQRSLQQQLQQQQQMALKQAEEYHEATSILHKVVLTYRANQHGWPLIVSVLWSVETS